MAKQTTTDVLIAGAGPTGLTLALALQQQGVKFRLIDRLAAPATVSKALAVWSGSLEAFAGLGVAEEFMSAGTRLRSVKMGDGARLLASIPVGEGLDTPYPPVLVPQWRTETILGSRAGKLGIAIERGVELESFVQDDQSVTATLRHADGSEEEVCAGYLVGADGARSIVRRTLGIAFEGYTEPEIFALGDVQIEGDLDGNSVYIWWHEGGTVALFPYGNAVWRVFAARTDEKDDATPTLEELQTYVKLHGPPGLRLQDPVWLSAFRTNERLAASFRAGRVFLAGDAAHIHTPAGGQGMNIGVQDAIDLGWKLGYVLKGRGDADILLDSYEAERRPIARETIDAAAQRLHAGMARNRLVTMLRDIVVSAVGHLEFAQEFLRLQLSETETVYRDGPLVALGEPPRRPKRTDVGGRARDFSFIDADTGATRTLWPLLAGGHHTLLLFEEADACVPTNGIAAFTGPALVILRLDEASDPDGAARARYHMEDLGWVLIRPDQFVAARGEVDDVGPLLTYIERIIAPANP